MDGRSPTARLARSAAAHPWRTVGAWALVILISLVGVATLLGDALTGEGEVVTETESKRGEELIAERLPEAFGASDVVLVRSETLTAGDPAFQAEIERLVQEGLATGLLDEQAIATGSVDDLPVSPDGHAVLVPLPLAGDEIGPIVELVERADGRGGFQLAIAGSQTADRDFETLSQEDLQKGELMVGAPAALVVLLLVFGTIVAGLVPLVLAVVSIVIALALTALVGQAFELSFFVVNMITGMGLALGIDYSLFVLSRYREERGHGLEKLDAIERAGATASRAVLVSGLAFVLAMFGMVLVPDTILRSLAVGAILVGGVSVLAALTLLPAVLGLLGDRVNALRIPFVGRSLDREAGAEGRFWSAIVRRVVHRPVVSLVLSAGLLLAMAVPVLDLERGSAGISTLPDRFASKQGFLALEQSFPGSTVDPALVVVDGDVRSPEVQAAVDRLASTLAERPPFGEPELELSPGGDLAVLRVPVGGDAQSEEAIEAVRDLRSDLVPAAFAGTGAEVFVTGDTAESVDYFDLIGHWLPLVFAFVLGLSFLLLVVAFRSLVVPLVAIVLNLLSVGAAYGLLVLVFQKGYLVDFFGFQQVDAVEAWVPLFLFSVLFGLSMDYQVFLLTRIRERYERSGDTRRAVIFGVGSTARLITGAALIIVAVFIGFAAGDLAMFQQMGFGVAVSLLIDATIVRSVLMPAALAVIGDRSWYLPRWLAWLPELDVEGGRARG